MLNAFKKLAPILPDLMGTRKLAVWATDLEKYILFDDYAGFETGMDVGVRIPEGGSSFIAMREKKPLERIVPKEVYGRELHSFIVPVEGGTIGITFDFEDTKQITDAIQNLSASQEEIFSSSSGMAEHTKDIAKWMNNVENSAKEAIEQKANIEKVVLTIKEIVDTLGLLSLNSMIEAARAGEHGRTFTVVANEVKQLAVQGKTNVEEISVVLKNITVMLQSIYDEIANMNDKIKELTDTSFEIANATEHIAASVQSLDTMADKLR